ncbi:unnamed protein product [Diabrotica balteata]|uniref:Invertebrate defensins family profile domain-containing protein n=1 Tax=Diabrotica balteata TaxID=107213 RepID=A0A9P0DSF8_DIABA|nr:unnamed protein product [Diabrotica balteata]
MKSVIIVVLIGILIVTVIAVPLVEEDISDDHIRVKRLTCEVLGSVNVANVQLNDAPCYLKCKLKNRPGGYCDSTKKCRCR